MNSLEAYNYALNNPDKRHTVIDKITKSNDAYYWARKWPEDKHIMISRITESLEAFWWARDWPEDKHIMIDRVTESKWAFNWAEHWPEDYVKLATNSQKIHDRFLDKLKLSQSVEWIHTFPEDREQVYKKFNFPGSWCQEGTLFRYSNEFIRSM